MVSKSFGYSLLSKSFKYNKNSSPVLFLSQTHSQQKRHRIEFSHSSFKYFSSTKTSSTINSATKDENLNRLNELMSVFRQVVNSPDIAQVGLIRSFQVARALNKIIQEFTQKRENFNDKDGNFSLPKTLRKLFEELGATYIKLGQFIASSPTLFPAEYVTEFQSCLDKSPTVPYTTIRKIILDDLKQPISSIFLNIDPVPIASASIAQVHRATLKNGKNVVIKVRKPGVDSTLKADLGFLLIASKVIELINPSLTTLSLSNIISDIRESMLDELDFKKEAANLENFRSFLEKNDITDATAPKPYPSASGTKVLTMDYLKGVPLIDLEGIRRFSDSPEGTLVSALRTWAISVATNDIFHADVHAGNLLVLEDGRIGFIDFGIVGKISNKFRDGLSSLFDSLLADNFLGVAESLVSLGATNTNVNADKFAKELEEVVKKINNLQPELIVQSDGDSVEARLSIDERETTQLVLSIVNIAEKNGLKLPREFGLILKQALYFDRYQKLLAPTLDPLRDSRLRSSFGDQIFTPPNGSKAQVKIIDVEIVE